MLKDEIYSFIRELSVVFIGVTAAFVISSRHDQNQLNILELNVISTIASEQFENIQRIDASLILNQEMITNYDTIIKHKENSTKSEYSITLTVGKCLFNDTGFDLAVQSRVLSRLPFNVFKDISWCYKLQKSSIELQTTYINYLGSDIKERDAAFYRAAKNKLKDVNRAFEMLKKEAQSLVEKIDPKKHL